MSERNIKKKVGEWLISPTGPIWDEVVRMIYRRQIFRGFMDICKQAPMVVQESGTEFQHWAVSNYGQAQAVAIRKLNDNRRDTQSMRRLLVIMARIPEFEDVANRDLERLTETIQPVQNHVDTAIAHLGDPARVHPPKRERMESISVTWEMLHNCVDLYSELLKDYSLRIQNVTPRLDEVIMRPWEYAFKFAWINTDTPTIR